MVGTPVTFTATVAGALRLPLPIITPTGSVVFKDNGVAIGNGTLDSNGKATLTTSSLGVGSHPITVTYNGDTIYNPATSAVLNQSIVQGATTTTVASSSNPSQFGSNVTFTATVSGAPSGLTPTGTVTFKDGAVAIGSGTLNGSGQATFSTSALSGGSHSITAAYGGDTNFTGSTSSALTQTVNPVSSSTGVVASPNPATFGSSVTFTATVSSGGGTPTGTVTFKDGGSTIGSATLDGSGQATLTTASESVGVHAITAVYAGNGNFATSTSPPLSFTVNQAASTTTVTSSENPSATGEAVTFTATVTGTGVVATGTVTFKDGAATLGTGSLNGSGIATFTTSALVLGSHSITAVYGGDGNYSGGSSPVLTQTVNGNPSTTTLGSSVNPSTFGTAVTFTATVSGAGATPTGTVTFRDGAGTIGTGSLNGAGHATLTIATLSGGGHSITAVYGGDGNYSSSTSATLSQNVNPSPSSTAVTASSNPSAIGEAVTFTATVSGSGGTPTGTVTFKDGAATLGTGTLNGSGQAVLTTSALALGGHSITATYGGDGNFSSSTSPPLTQTVDQNGSATTLSSATNPSSFGSSVTFTATVSGVGGTPTGTVTFKDGAATLGTGTLNGSGQATFATSALSGGSHSMTAVYGGDGNFSTSTSPTLTQVVNPTSSSTSVAASPNPSTFGAAVTFTATVSGSGATPTGTVTFKDGASVLGTGTLNGSGQATLTTASEAVGSHAISAVYGGDGNFATSTSPPLTFTVNQATSGTTVVSSVNPSAVGAPVTFTATVTGAGGTPSGTVTFKDGATSLGTGSLNGSGIATLTTSALALGGHAVTAVYGGDANFTGSTSAVLTQTVNANASTTTLGSSANPSTFGASVTFTATVTGAGATPTGTVTFSDGGTAIGTTALNGSAQATVTISTLAAGSHTITAAYGGDATHAAGTSSPLTQTVNPTSSSTSVSASSNPATFGNPVTFTATVTGGGATPTGVVTFKDGGSTIGTGTLNGSGQATLTTASEAVGSHSITAVYGGDGNFATSTSPPLTFTVNQAGSSTTVTSSASPSAVGDPVTFTVRVTTPNGIASGTVTIDDGGTSLGSTTLGANGMATFTTSALALGSHTIRAIYGGDGNFAGSTSAAITQTVSANSSTTTLASSVNPSAFGAAVTFTATVSGAGAIPSGTVTFKDGGNAIGSGSLDGSGHATLTTSQLAAGNHAISATYGGDATHATSISPTITQAVGQNATTTALQAAPNPVSSGAPVTLTATVSAAGGTPTGAITFRDGAAILGTVTLNGSAQAVLTVSSFAGGTHSIGAAYGGDSNFTASAASPVSLVANQNGTAVNLTASPNPAAVGTPVTLTATVTANGSATGNVTFKDGATALGTAALNGSAQASLSVATLATGTHSITAVYGGDINFAPATSAPINEVIQQRTLTVSLSSSLNPSVAGQPVTFTAAVTASFGTSRAASALAAPGGTVSFSDGSAVIGTISLSGGAAALTTSSLVSGSHSITATYSGDPNYVPATSVPLTQSVNLPADSLKLRALQLAATKIAAEDSGAAVAGAIHSAVSEGFADDGAMFAPGGSGFRFNSAGTSGGGRNTAKEKPRWLLWTDMVHSGLETGRPNQDMTGEQWNGLAGMTFRATPNFLVGVLGGYEFFDYSSQPLDGRLRGAGWTAGAYLGWRPLSGLRFEAGMAYSGLNFDGVAGMASGSFPGYRMLATTGLTGNYKVTQHLEFEPSLAAFALAEAERSYVDSLGTAQGSRSFSAGRASVGTKWLYRSQWGDLSVTPYLGMYGDYYFSKDKDAPTAIAPSLDGGSLRATSGLTITTPGAAQFTVGGELGGIGSGSFTIWSARTRLAVPF